MALSTGRELIEDGYKNGYAIGGFCVFNMEFVAAVVEAAEEEKSPVILLIGEKAIDYAGLDYISNISKTAADAASVPVVIQLDHGTSFDSNVKCLKAGFSALMFDGSAQLFEENVSITSQIVKMAHSCGIPVEGEIGKVPGAEQNYTPEEISAMKTNPARVREFVELTKLDTLSVALGAVHRMQTKSAVLDMALLKKIHKEVDIPIILHGASGVTIESIQDGIKNGIAKVNVGTQLLMAFLNETYQYGVERPEEVDYRKIFKKARASVKDIAKSYMRLFGCSGKA